MKTVTRGGGGTFHEYAEDVFLVVEGECGRNLPPGHCFHLILFNFDITVLIFTRGTPSVRRML